MKEHDSQQYNYKQQPLVDAEIIAEGIRLLNKDLCL
jgi:hypothetical protein